MTYGIFFYLNMEVNGATKLPGYKSYSKYLPLCSAEQINSYRFGTIWGWHSFHFDRTIPLNKTCLTKWSMLKEQDMPRSKEMKEQITKKNS